MKQREAWHGGVRQRRHGRAINVSQQEKTIAVQAMNNPDSLLNIDAPVPSIEKTCAENSTARTIGAEQLRRFLIDRRNRLRKERSALLQAADRIKAEVATYDALLAELII